MQKEAQPNRVPGLGICESCSAQQTLTDLNPLYRCLSSEWDVLQLEAGVIYVEQRLERTSRRIRIIHDDNDEHTTLS